jgi:hypothetical protein
MIQIRIVCRHVTHLWMNVPCEDKLHTYWGLLTFIFPSAIPVLLRGMADFRTEGILTAYLMVLLCFEAAVLGISL